MGAPWERAIEAAADTLCEMLVEIAEGRGEHDNEDIAAAVLRTALDLLVEGPPALERLDEVGRTLYAKLHDGGQKPWPALSDVERGFWMDLAASAVAASDASLLLTCNGAGGPFG